MHQIFKRLEENKVCSYDDLMDAAANYNYNYAFLDGIEQGDPTRLEGFLFPDTYEFYVGMQASSAINKLLENFHYRVTDEMITQMTNMGLDIRSVVTMASLIEREAANDNERGLIASVIYNRLAVGMPLGIDASILYIHPDHEGAPTADMLTEDSPYNTRLYEASPPTPIANPGLARYRPCLRRRARITITMRSTRRRGSIGSSRIPASSTPLSQHRTMNDMFALLSPAGDMERLMMCLNYGADAVYLAGRRFGMRAAAVNFSDEELVRAVELAHGRACGSMSPATPSRGRMSLPRYRRTSHFFRMRAWMR